MSRRAFSLVELMIAIAILGITAALAGGVGRNSRLDALAELQRERAQLLLEYHAHCRVGGVAPDDAVVSRLTRALPAATLIAVEEAPTVTLAVQWNGPRARPETRRLTVFAGTR